MLLRAASGAAPPPSQHGTRSAPLVSLRAEDGGSLSGTAERVPTSGVLGLAFSVGRTTLGSDDSNQSSSNSAAGGRALSAFSMPAASAASAGGPLGASLDTMLEGLPGVPTYSAFAGLGGQGAAPGPRRPDGQAGGGESSSAGGEGARAVAGEGAVLFERLCKL
jgi:hypothetical protein